MSLGKPGNERSHQAPVSQCHQEVLAPGVDRACPRAPSEPGGQGSSKALPGKSACGALCSPTPVRKVTAQLREALGLQGLTLGQH